MTEVKVLTNELHDLLCMFYFGCLVGSRSPEIKVPEGSDETAIFLPVDAKLTTLYNEVLKIGEKDWEKNVLGAFRGMGVDVALTGEPHERIEMALHADAILKRIGRLSQTIAMPGRGSVNTDQLEALKELLDEYLG